MAILKKDDDQRVADLFNQFAGQAVQPTLDMSEVDENDPVIVSLKQEASKHGFTVRLYPLIDYGMLGGGHPNRLTVYFHKNADGDFLVDDMELEHYDMNFNNPPPPTTGL